MRLDAVQKRYTRRGPWVLAGVDLELTPGIAVQVAGGNGSGKSTLLRLLAGVQAPTRGAVLGRPAVVGYVPERFPPALRFSPVEYLRLLARARGIADADRRVSALLEGFDLAPHAARRLGELSKGTVQKVAVAQALLASPDLLVLDESWSGLDAAAQAVLAEEVHGRAAAGGIVVFTDHARRAHQVRADLHLELKEGLLADSVEPVRPAMTRVELRDSTGQLRSLDVPAAKVDATLREALATGWSVLRVEPAS